MNKKINIELIVPIEIHSSEFFAAVVEGLKKTKFTKNDKICELKADLVFMTPFNEHSVMFVLVEKKDELI